MPRSLLALNSWQKLAIVIEEADETAFWLEFLIDAGLDFGAEAEGSEFRGRTEVGGDLQRIENHREEKFSINNQQSKINNSPKESIVITAKAIWTDKERYIGEASSRHAVVMDTATEKTANSPMELVLIALCGCTASDVVGVLRKKREPFTSLEVSATGEQAVRAILPCSRKSLSSIASVVKFHARR